MGEVILAAGKPSGGGNSFVFLLIIVVLFGLLYFVTIRPQRNRQRQALQTQREVGPGARVRTTAGMYGTVTAVDGDDVILELSPGVEVRFLRRAIMEVVSDGTVPEPAAGYGAPEDGAAEEEEPEDTASQDGPDPDEDGVAEPGSTVQAEGAGQPNGAAPADGAAKAETAKAERKRPAG